MKKLPLLFILFFSFTCAFAQLLTPRVDSIPMRDSKKLAADIYQPSGCTQCPTILIQTPYNRQFYRFNLPLGIRKALDSIPYNIVIVDWRGFWGSRDARAAGSNGGEDGYDVVEWIAAQSWSDGKIGTWGPSALGRVQYSTARNQPPHLVCGIPVVAGPQFNYLEYYPGGVYRTEYMAQVSALGFGTALLVNPNPVKNLIWDISENSTFYPDEIAVPMLLIGGWYDHNVGPMVDFFEGLQQQSPVSGHKLLMGPWTHGGNGRSQPGSSGQGELAYPNAANWNDSMARAFFDYHLLGANNGWDQTPAVTYYQMGENTWKGHSNWDQASQSTAYYLHPDTSLQLAIATNGNLSFDYDPHDPSPTLGGPTLQLGQVQGPYDQRAVVESRADALVFSTDVLTEAIAVRGKVQVVLYVSTDRRDTDVAVRLTDVYPDGKSMLVRDGIRRLRFREGYRAADTMLAVPGQVYRLEIDLEAVAHTFVAGHRLRLVVSGANYPRFDSNLNNGGAMYTAGDTLVSHTTLHFSQTAPSHINLPTEPSVSVEEEIAWQNVQIFPQPAKDRFWITSPEHIETVSLYDLQGRLLLHQKPSSTISILKVGHLPPGVYVLALEREGRRFSKKVVIGE